jgi:hypothetical protein
MRRAKVFLVAVMTISLAGCVLSGKPKAVAAAPAPPQPAALAPPAEPLSIPQTQVDLPAPQPVKPAALVTELPEQASQPEPAKPPEPVKPPPRNSSTTAPPKTTPDPQPAADPIEPARPPIREIVPPDEQKVLLERAHKNQAETQTLLAGVKPHTNNQERAVAEINQFLKQSEQAESTGDMRLADQLAERAYILAKELQSGK